MRDNNQEVVVTLLNLVLNMTSASFDPDDHSELMRLFEKYYPESLKEIQRRWDMQLGVK